jgi:hypothetical protein
MLAVFDRKLQMLAATSVGSPITANALTPLSKTKTALMGVEVAMRFYLDLSKYQLMQLS